MTLFVIGSSPLIFCSLMEITWNRPSNVTGKSGHPLLCQTELSLSMMRACFRLAGRRRTMVPCVSSTVFSEAAHPPHGVSSKKLTPSSLCRGGISPSMITIGINYSQMHDSSACLVRDGELLFAVAEERISRIKHDAGFPENA